MESSIHRRQEKEQEQAEIRRQIAALQARLEDKPETSGPSNNVLLTPKKRKQDHQNLLAPRTPSPKKQKVSKEPFNKSLTTLHSSKSQVLQRLRPAHPHSSQSHCVDQPRPSTVLSKLASLSHSKQEQPDARLSRSSGFLEQAPLKPIGDHDAPLYQRRDENLALIEDLEPGPYEHIAPFDDPRFQKLEPNSGIRLSSRAIPHDDFQDYLRGRYYLSPSRLYSVIRLLPSKQGYDVPVEGDWLTIAVVAERGQMKFSRAPVGIGKDEGNGMQEDDIKTLSLDAPAKPEQPHYSKWKGRAKEELDNRKPSGKRYVNLKLIDFGCRTKSSATGEKSTIRGDAFLSLLLFECDHVEEVVHADGRKEKLYKGGSRGAFERMSKLKEGAVVALLNPKILRPFQRSGDKPHPTDNILALTPESIDAVAVIGHSLDLGMCTVLKRDGKVCGGWCDKRVSDVCDWHVQHAVQQKRAGRAEFSHGTSGMTTAAKTKKEYDPRRQWGLKPDPDHDIGGATYVMSGHIVSSGADAKSMFIGENMGRDAQAKAARKTQAKDADLELQKLLKRDKEGTKAVAAAREHAKKLAEQQTLEKGAAQRKKKTKKDGASSKEREPPTIDANKDTADTSKSLYSVSLIRTLGFDPTGKDGRKAINKDVQKKLETLASVQSSRKTIALGPRPGKLKSTVRAPEVQSGSTQNSYSKSTSDTSLLPEVDSKSDEELEREIATFGRSAAKMVDLDSTSSDVELEVEPPS